MINPVAENKKGTALDFLMAGSIDVTLQLFDFYRVVWISCDLVI